MSNTTREALKHLKAMAEFACQHGFHELGYDPVETIAVAIAKANAEEAKPAPERQVIGEVVACDDYGSTIRWTANAMPTIGTKLFAALPAPVDAKPVQDKKRDHFGIDADVIASVQKKLKAAGFAPVDAHPADTITFTAQQLENYRARTIAETVEKFSGQPANSEDDAWASFKVMYGENVKRHPNSDWRGFRRGWVCALAAIRQDVSVINYGDMQPIGSAFPERDTSKPAEAQGIFHKFDVTRTDGSDRPGGKHYGCRYFVIDMDHDAHAAAALSAYGVSCKDTHPELSADLLREFPAQPVQAEPSAAVPENWREELLDWVSACQSAYHIESTPRHRFGGMPGALSENRDAIVSYVEELISAAAPAQQVQPAAQPVSGALNWVKDMYGFIESTCPEGFADEVFRVAPEEVKEAIAAAKTQPCNDAGISAFNTQATGRVEIVQPASGAVDELRKLYVELTNGQQIAEDDDIIGYVILSKQLDQLEALVSALSAVNQVNAAQPEAARCKTCDGTRDVHGMDGEWRGGCTACEAAQPEKDAELATVSAYSIGDVKVEAVWQIDGPFLWAARKHGNCLNKSGEWEYEPLPSGRDDDFLSRCRFNSAADAIRAAIAAQPAKSEQR